MIDLDGDLDLGIPNIPNHMLYVYFPIFDQDLPDLNKPARLVAALVLYGFFGLKPMRLLQGIASGLLGPKAFSGGRATAVLGVFCHFLIAFGAAAVYLVASRAFAFLIEH